MVKRIGLLTAGGDAPGLNVCLKTIVTGATESGFEVVGIRKGWEGLLHLDPQDPSTHSDNAMLLTRARVRDIDRMSGSFLHSSRVDPGQVHSQAAPIRFRSDATGDHPLDLTSQVTRAVETLGLDTLVLLGDNFSLTYAARLSREGIPVLGIPKSVHNDVNGSDYCLGFSTALAQGVRLMNDVRAMAGSREEVAVVEMFGRTSGLTTLLVGMLAGADRTLIPEVPFDPERLAALLMEDKRTNANNYAMLAMSESVSIDPQRADRYGPEANRRMGARRPAAEGGSAAAEPHLEAYTIAGDRTIGLGAAGAGAAVTELLENLTGQRLLYQPLTYLLRVGLPDGQDLLGAMNFATMAVHLLNEGKSGRLVAYQRGDNYVDMPLEVVTEPGRGSGAPEHYDPLTLRARPSILWAARI